MNIYLAIPHITQIIDIAEENLEKKLDYTFDRERTKTLLSEKKVFLIDTFNTFVPPAISYDESITLERLGVIGYLKTKKIRSGFRDFLNYYDQKIIGIHSDSLSKKEFSKINDRWHFENVNFFGYEYTIYNKKSGSFFHDSEKDFLSMIKELGELKEETLIIGDGLTDIKPAYKQDIDLLLIPTYKQNKSFNFRTLYQS